MTDKEKLDRMKKLADAMYHSAFDMTTDASRLRKAMDAYHQFIITEYNKQEPASENLEQAAIDYDSRRPALYGEDDEGDYVEYIEVRKDAFIAGAQWQKEQMMKDAIDATVTSIREYREENEVDFTIMLDKGIASYVSEEDVKLIIIKE